MANANDVMHELFPAGVPGDTIIMYEGASNKWYSWARGPNGGWSAYDMRGWLRQLTWDLLRFRPLEDAEIAPDDKPVGLWDAVLRIAKQTDENNRLLKQLVERLDNETSADNG